MMSRGNRSRLRSSWNHALFVLFLHPCSYWVWCVWVAFFVCQVSSLLSSFFDRGFRTLPRTTSSISWSGSLSFFLAFSFIIAFSGKRGQGDGPTFVFAFVSFGTPDCLLPFPSFGLVSCWTSTKISSESFQGLFCSIYFSFCKQPG